MVVATLALWMLTACDPPHAWDQVTLDTSRLDDPTWALASYNTGQGRFASWTGRDRTRVRTVTFVDEICGGRCGGRYNSVSHGIRLLPTVPPNYAMHELCHSLDDEEGRPSEDAADMLAPYGDGLPGDLYPTRTARVHEVFAELCEQGPQTLGMVLELHPACGTEGPVDAARFVGETAFPGFHEVDLPARSVSLRTLSRALAGTTVSALWANVQAVATPWTAAP